MAEVLDTGPDRPRWSPPRWLVLLAAATALVTAFAVAAVTGGRGDDRAASVARSDSSAPAAPAATTAPALPACAGTTSGPVPSAAWTHAAAVALGHPVPGQTLTRRDPANRRGPWTVAVRRLDGSLGRHGAVVTFPAAPVTGSRVDVGGARGAAQGGLVVWPVAGAHARVRGDLGRTALVAIAERTAVVRSRPVVRPPRGYRAFGVQPYRAGEVHEVRYVDRGGLGAFGERLGFVYTGVLRAGGFEDQLYARGAVPAGDVDGREAVTSSVQGGNATLAWSPAPGVVAYVGYSGVTFGRDAATALRCLARRSRPLTEAQWRFTSPAVVPDTNDFG